MESTDWDTRKIRTIIKSEMSKAHDLRLRDLAIARVSPGISICETSTISITKGTYKSEIAFVYPLEKYNLDIEELMV